MKRHVETFWRGFALSLLITGTSFVAHAAEIAPAPRPVAVNVPIKANNALAHTQWELVSPAYAGIENVPYLKFTDNRLSASVGLNMLGAEYSVAGEKIAFSYLFSTKMAGPPELMKAENQYAKDLEDARTFEVSADGKTLTLRGQKTLMFRVQVIAKDVLDNTQWELVSPVYKSINKTPFLKFKDNRLSASVGLNALNAEYSVNGKTLEIKRMISTRMAGPAPLMSAEARYSKALQNTRTFATSADGETLVLRGAQRLIFRPLTSAQNTLAGTSWELISPKFVGVEKAPTLKFTDNTISASAGLNILGAEYSLNGPKITWNHFLSTQMAGPPDLMKAEARYSEALRNARTVEVSNDGQTLVLRGKETLTFRFTSYTKTGFEKTETKIINVAPQLGPQMDGDKSARYLQLEDLSEGLSWGHFTEAKIEGFDFVPGYRYQLSVAVESDARSGEKQLRLLDVISQRWMQKVRLEANQKILEVAPAKVDCVGLGPTKCLLVRESGGQWENFYEPIEGFDYREGRLFRLLVEVTKVKNPPADGSSLRCKLVRLLDVIPVVV